MTEASVSGKVVLPKTANLSDTKISVNPKSDSEDDTVVGEVVYTYGSRQVGKGNLVFSSTNQASYPFHNLNEEEGGSSVKFYRFNFLLVLEIILLAALGCVVVFLLYRQWNKWSVKIHRHREETKRRKPQYKVIKRRKRRRR